MKKVVMYQSTLRRAIKESNGDTNPLHGKALLPHIPVKMTVEVPDEDFEEMQQDPRLFAILQETFKEQLNSYCRHVIVPKLDILNTDWDKLSKLSDFQARWHKMFNELKSEVPKICEAAEKAMHQKMAEDATLRQKYKHYRWKVGKQAAVTTLAVGTAAAATAGSVAAGGATLGLAVVGLYRSVASGVKLIRDCAIEAETCQKNVIYGLAHIAKSYGLTDHTGDGETGRLAGLMQADMAGYSPGGAKKAGNTAKELSYNFFINSVLKWPLKKRLTSVKDIKVESELWENKLANLTFQSRDLSIKLNKQLEEVDDFKEKTRLGEQIARLQADIAREVEPYKGDVFKQDQIRVKLMKEFEEDVYGPYRESLAKLQKPVKQLLDKGFYIPSMAKWLTIDELHKRAEAGLKKLENLKPIVKTLENKGLGEGTLIASDALDMAVSITLAIAGDTYGPLNPGPDTNNAALNFLASDWFEAFTVPQDFYGAVNASYTFAVDTCGAPAVQTEFARVALES